MSERRALLSCLTPSDHLLRWCQGLTVPDRDPFSLLFTFSPLSLGGDAATLVFGGHFLAFELVVC